MKLSSKIQSLGAVNFQINSEINSRLGSTISTKACCSLEMDHPFHKTPEIDFNSDIEGCSVEGLVEDWWYCGETLEFPEEIFGKSEELDFFRFSDIERINNHILSIVDKFEGNEAALLLLLSNMERLQVALGEIDELTSGIDIFAIDDSKKSEASELISQALALLGADCEGPEFKWTLSYEKTSQDMKVKEQALKDFAVFRMYSFDSIILDASGIGVTEFPKNVHFFKELRTILFAGKGLTYFPDGIRSLRKLYYLDLKSNKISVLPESLSVLKNLEKLNLSCNRFLEIPECINDLENLKELNFSGNKISVLPESIGALKNLKKLNLSENKLSVLPESIGALENLKELNLSENELLGLPESLSNLKNLKDFNISYNIFSELPGCIEELLKLPDLTLHNNCFSKLPEIINALAKIKRYYLKNDQVTQYYSLPKYYKHCGTKFIIKETMDIIIALATEYPKGTINALTKREKRVAQKYGLCVIGDVKKEQEEILVLQTLLDSTSAY